MGVNYCEGFAFWIEVKVGRDKLRRDQVAFALVESRLPPPHREVIVGGLTEAVAHFNAMRPNRKIKVI